VSPLSTLALLEKELRDEDNLPLSWRWRAPELLDEAYLQRGAFKGTLQSDVFAFARFCLEVHTGDMPFGSHVKPSEYILLAQHGVLPIQPESMDDATWNVLKRCWEVRPEDRPSMREVVHMLETIWET
jgi:hypothetical protein